MESSHRIVLLLTENHLGSEIVLHMLHKELPIVGAVVSPPARSWIKIVQAVKKMGPSLVFGLWSQHMLTRSMLSINAWSHAKHSVKPLSTTLRERGIPSIRTLDVHDDTTRKFMTGLQPTLLVSAFFSQILKANVLQIPSVGALNVHPADIEAFRGAMNYFWVLRHNAPSTAATLHWMDTGIDTGALVAKSEFTLSKSDTQFNLVKRTAQHGAVLLNFHLQCIDKKKAQKEQSKGCYYSFPSAADFCIYRNTKKLFTLAEMVSLLYPLPELVLSNDSYSLL